MSILSFSFPDSVSPHMQLWRPLGQGWPQPLDLLLRQLLPAPQCLHCQGELGLSMLVIFSLNLVVRAWPERAAACSTGNLWRGFTTVTSLVRSWGWKLCVCPPWWGQVLSIQLFCRDGLADGYVLLFSLYPSHRRWHGLPPYHWDPGMQGTGWRQGHLACTWWRWSTLVSGGEDRLQPCHVALHTCVCW